MSMLLTKEELTAISEGKALYKAVTEAERLGFSKELITDILKENKSVIDNFPDYRYSEHVIAAKFSEWAVKYGI